MYGYEIKNQGLFQVSKRQFKIWRIAALNKYVIHPVTFSMQFGANTPTYVIQMQYVKNKWYTHIAYGCLHPVVYGNCHLAMDA